MHAFSVTVKFLSLLHVSLTNFEMYVNSYGSVSIGYFYYHENGVLRRKDVTSHIFSIIPTRGRALKYDLYQIDRCMHYKLYDCDQ
jgi:hypothetical protein